MKITIDKAGRVVLPKVVRDEFGLSPGTTLDLEATEDAIVLRPQVDRPNVRVKGGLLVIVANPSEELCGALERSREERLDGLVSFSPERAMSREKS